MIKTVETENQGLKRAFMLTIPAEDIDARVEKEVKRIAPQVRMPGFRPGKVPMKLVAQTYGPQVHNEVLGDAVQKSFTDAVREANLKVAGYPRIERKDNSSATSLEFSATFEIYPEVKVGDLAERTIERPKTEIADADVDKTIEILRKQRMRFVAASREARDGDRVNVDFDGRIGGEPFDGGKAAGFAFVLGEGRMLPQFETAARGMKPGESKTFTLKFPDDYHGQAVAGKEATFDIRLNSVEEP